MSRFQNMCEQYSRSRLRLKAYDEIASTISTNFEAMIERQPYKVNGKTPTVVSILSGGGAASRYDVEISRN